MTQTERRIFLITELLKERPEYADMKIPADEREQKRLLRSLFNIRPPVPASEEFLRIQDTYLQEETRRKGITDADSLSPVLPGIFLWQGAIVNAANSGMTGCYIPCHGCIDNMIHTFAGVQLRLACAKQMNRQGHAEKTGTAKLTPAFNLPCRFVIHTVGPIIRGRVTETDERLLESCYRSCLQIAEKNGVESLAFCCISTGEFHFPNDRAAEIALKAVTEHRKQTQSGLRVIFNVFRDTDAEIYRALLEEKRKNL